MLYKYIDTNYALLKTFTQSFKGKLIIIKIINEFIRKKYFRKNLRDIDSDWENQNIRKENNYIIKFFIHK
jgi:hypothetical protein